MRTNRLNTLPPPQPAPPSRASEPSEPSEPSVVDSARQLTNWLGELQRELDTLHHGMLDPLPAHPPDEHEGYESLRTLIADACTHAAQMVGFVRTINSRVGFGQN